MLHPEWTPISALWTGWPTLPAEWGAAFEPARAEIAEFVRLASKSAIVRVLAGSVEAVSNAEEEIGSIAETLSGPMGDIWLRDTGPVFAGKGHAARALTFSFNGWGGKYIMPGDTETASFIAAEENVIEQRSPIILEGGAIDFDGDGTLLTTRQCLLNSNRNTRWTQAEAETALNRSFGTTRTVWLDQGLMNDHTDGHVDNLARFIAPGHVVCQHPTGDNDPNAEVYRATEKALRHSGMTVSTIPSPGRVLNEDGENLPASHLNFVLANGTLILPVYAEQSGQAARDALVRLLPDWRIEPLSARAILAGGGGFHCMTCQVPAALGGVSA